MEPECEACGANRDEIVRLRADVTALDRLIEEKLRARDQALGVADRALLRMEARQNEWRQTVTDIATGKADKSAHDDLVKTVDALRGSTITRAEHDTVVTRVGTVELLVGQQTGGSSTQARLLVGAAVLISLVGLIITVVHLINGG